MKRFKRFSLLLTAFCFFGLSGCAPLALISLAPYAGSMSDGNSTDAHLVTTRLSTQVTGDSFVEGVKAVSGQLGYQVAFVNGHGATTRGVSVMKQSEDMAGAFIGRDWNYTVSLSLEEDGRTIGISARTAGNNHRADPGTAQKIAEEFKAKIDDYYSSRQTKPGVAEKGS